MRYQNCKFGEKCRYFHPRGLKNVSNKKEKHSDQKIVEERNTYANVAKKSLQPQIKPNDPFLGISQPVHQNFIGQAHQVQQPFLGPQAFLEIQKNQKQMMDLFMNLNRKVNNMFNMQMS